MKAYTKTSTILVKENWFCSATGFSGRADVLAGEDGGQASFNMSCSTLITNQCRCVKTCWSRVTGRCCREASVVSWC